MNVNGTLYDVDFVHGSGSELFPDWFSGGFDFVTAGDAFAAFLALLDQMFLNTPRKAS